MDSFKKTIIIQSTNDKVYDALTNAITKWWTEMFEGTSNQEGQSFTIRFGANVFKTMIVEELIKNEKVVWNVTDSLIDIPDLNNKKEWINTKIVWKISTQDNQTELHLTHFGLTPQVECYNICQDGWHNFIDSLTQFINTGIGKPFKP
ncbi:MAG: SRPBCC family protein [Flavobacteriales bacterium]